MDTNFKKKLLLLFTALLSACALFAFGLTGLFSVSAQNSVTSSFFAPNTALEYYELTNPQGVYIDNDVAAIIQNDKTLIVYDQTNGFRTSGYSGFSSLKQVKRWSDNQLVLIDYAGLILIDLNDLDATPTNLTYNSIAMNANNFDLNDRYLVTIFNEVVKVFTLDDTTITAETEFNRANNTTQPISINAANEIFYVSNSNKICKCNATSTDNVTELISATPSAMVASTEFVYFIEGNEIYRISVNGGEKEQLTDIANATKPTPNDGYDLGKLSAPQAICFRGENLLITDSSLNAIQEFRVVSDTASGSTKNALEFTGFAIAKNKTAFNRTDTTVKEVEIYGNTQAVLTEKELFVTTLSANQYDRNNYKHFAFNDTLKANMFALGDGTAFLVDTSANVKQARILTLSNGTTTDALALEYNIVTDVVYQSGIYYILQLEHVQSSSNFNAHIYSYVEGAENFELTEILVANAIFDQKSKFTVDVFGNVFMTANDNKIYSFARTTDGYGEKQAVANSTSNDVIKLTTDLGGALFALSPNSVTVYYGDQADTMPLTVNTGLETLTPVSMAMNFDSDNVYVLGQGSEVVFTANTLSNLSIQNVTVPADYVLTSSEANIDNLRIYNVRKGANVYSVTKADTTFTYNGLLGSLGTEEYLYICKNSLNSTTELAVLIGMKNGKESTVLVNVKDLVASTNVPADSDTEKAYIATDVNAYYLPVITYDNVFVLTNADGVIRLTHGTEIATTKTVTLFDKTFYYATIKVADADVNAFIPLDFTTKVLSQADNDTKFTNATVKSCTVYSDDALSLDGISLEANTVVRLYEIKDGVAKIAYKTGDAWTVGYVSEEFVNVPQSTALRNTLIIIAIALAVCGTSIYFILRRKEK